MQGASVSIRNDGMKLGLQLGEGLQLCGPRRHLLPRVHCAASGVPGLWAETSQQDFLQFVLQFRSLPVICCHVAPVYLQLFLQTFVVVFFCCLELIGNIVI